MTSETLKVLPELWINVLGMKFRLVQPGSFLMGSPKTESRRFADEEQRETVITRPFYMSLYLVTQAEWRAVEGENPSRFTLNRRAPVESVSWFDCNAFLEKLNAEEYGQELRKFPGGGWRYAFPTEAQWEYVCRAGTTTPYYFGSTVLGREGNFGKTSGTDYLKRTGDRNATGTTEIGLFPPNPWGFYDMCGNICEWTADYYADYDPEQKVDPVGAPANAERVARGGSWKSAPEACRSASRFNFLSTYRGENCGLRIAIVNDSADVGSQS